MTRRWPRPGTVRHHSTLGEKIGTHIAFGAALVGLILIASLMLAMVRTAHARDLGQWKDSDPYIAEWYRALKQPDNKFMSCCGPADAYFADIVETGPNGELIAVITDDRADEPLNRHHVPVGTRIVVPNYKIKYDQGNPTGHIVIFLSTVNEVFCYVQNGGV